MAHSLHGCIVMPGPIHALLSHDHDRLDALLDGAERGDAAAYHGLRAGLLRHIAQEERVLLPAARRLHGAPLPIAGRLRIDHGCLAALLVPPPSPVHLARMREILLPHNALEEEAGGLYETVETLAGSELADLCALLEAQPPVRLAPNLGGPRVEAHIELLLRKRAAFLEEA